MIVGRLGRLRPINVAAHFCVVFSARNLRNRWVVNAERGIWRRVATGRYPTGVGAASRFNPSRDVRYQADGQTFSSWRKHEALDNGGLQILLG